MNDIYTKHIRLFTEDKDDGCSTMIFNIEVGDYIYDGINSTIYKVLEFSSAECYQSNHYSDMKLLDCSVYSNLRTIKCDQIPHKIETWKWNHQSKFDVIIPVKVRHKSIDIDEDTFTKFTYINEDIKQIVVDCYFKKVPMKLTLYIYPCNIESKVIDYVLI